MVEKEEFRGDCLSRLAAVETDIRNIQRGLVQIAERGIEELSHPASDGGLAGPGKAYENDVPLHVPSSLQRRPRLATYPS